MSASPNDTFETAPLRARLGQSEATQIHSAEIDKTATRAGLDGLQRTYTGLLDDVMLRYADDYAGEQFFNKMIVKNIFFGGGLYFNDGYLVNHPTARSHLYNPDSLLRVMISNNFIRVLTRAPSPANLAQMPEKMAKDGNNSFQSLVASSEWTDFKPLFETIANAVFFTGNQRPWPAIHMSYGFTKLMSKALQAKPDDIGLTLLTEDEIRFLYDTFMASDPANANARNSLEEAARGVMAKTRNGDSFRQAMRQIMNIANQAYHYNFGLALTDEEETGVAVDTTLGRAFDELLETREIDKGQLNDIPLIQIPDNLPFDNGDLFRPFLDPTHPVSQAKFTYLQKLKLVLGPDPQGLSDAKKDVVAATDEYLNRIIELLQINFGKSVKSELGSSIFFARGVVDRQQGGSADEVIATAAPTGGLAITLQATAMSQSRQFLIERFRLRDASAAFKEGRHSSVTLNDIRPQIASLAFNPGAAANHTEDIPRF